MKKGVVNRPLKNNINNLNEQFTISNWRITKLLIKRGCLFAASLIVIGIELILLSTNHQ